MATIHAPDHLGDILVPWPAGARIKALDPTARPDSDSDRYDVILLFVKEERALKLGLQTAPPQLGITGGLWVGWPKMKSPLFDALKESHVREAGLTTGLVDNKICAIDQDWSGLRFVFRKERRPDIEWARVRSESS